jgi:UDP-N-acetylmuramoylalanine--D-glutamate ligase
MQTLVIGKGISGKAASGFLERRGHSVSSFDDRDMEPMPNLDRCELVVISPGVSPKHPLHLRAVEAGIPVMGEAELALRELNCRAIGITGTNGKTTVTLMTAHLLRQAGVEAHPLGNVGHPLSGAVDELPDDAVAVVELSSFQLETMSSQVFDVGIVLNVTPDHLDRYSSFDAYAAAKGRLRDCLKDGAAWICHESCRERFQPDFCYNSADFIESIIPLSYRDRGRMDVENAMAAFALCSQMKVTPAGLESFCKPPHRMERVRELDGVTYINDSKGTNLDAVCAGLTGLDGPIILIAGGQSKGSTFRELGGALRKVRLICAIGEAEEQIVDELGSEITVTPCGTLEKAVNHARGIARPGDTILLSPGCASFDQFRDYSQRGETFKIIVNNFEEKS